MLPEPRSTDHPGGRTAQYTGHPTASAMAVKKSFVWALPEQAEAAASGPPGDDEGVMAGDSDSAGGALEGVAGTDGLAVSAPLGEAPLGLAEATPVGSVLVGTLGGRDVVVPQAALPTSRRQRTIGRRTSVAPGRARCTG